MDRAVLRPGRFGKLLYVPLPSPEERGLILKALSRKKPIEANVDLIAIGKNESCKNLSGADLSALVCFISLFLIPTTHLPCLCAFVHGDFSVRFYLTRFSLSSLSLKLMLDE